MVIDSHCHILPPEFSARRTELLARDATFGTLFTRAESPMTTAEDLIEAMDLEGITIATVTGFGWTDVGVAVEANDYIIESVQRYPKRLTGFCSVSPAWGQTAVAELERCAAAGIVGIGELHPDTQGSDISDKSAMSPVMEAALERGMAVLVHSSEPVGHFYPGKGDTTPDKLYKFILNFPDNTIICAHWGGGLPFYALMPEVAEALANVYFDSAASAFLYRPEVYESVVRIVGADKVLFGSDYPLLKPGRLLAQVRNSSLEIDQQEALLWRNAARLFGLQV